MWLSQSLSDIFAEQENNAFIKGDGNGKPRGILLGMNYKNTINSHDQVNKNESDNGAGDKIPVRLRRQIFSHSGSHSCAK